MNQNNDLTNLTEEIPKEYLLLQVQKRQISNIIRTVLKEENLTYREACNRIKDLNYTQFTRVTSGSNYTIETLLKTLNGLGLELEIKRKKA